MKNNRFYYGLLALVLCFSGHSNAQEHKDLSLTTHFGAGIENVFEQGYSPLQYVGPVGNLGLDFSGEWNRLRLEIEQRGSYSLSLNRLSQAKVHCINYLGNASLQYLWKASETNRLWAGGGLGDELNIYHNTGGENASYSLSNFVDINLCATLEHDFACHKGNPEKNFTAFGKLRLAALSFAKRPGFSYMTGDMMSNKMRITDDTYEHFVKGLSCITTEVGAAYHLKNHNRIACSYLWTYRSSGKLCAARYDHALHFLQFSFTFNLTYDENYKH